MAKSDDKHGVERRWRYGGVAGAAFVAALLVGGAAWMRHQIADASDAVVRGQADAFSSSLRELWRAGPVDDAALARFLADQHDDGLRYVGIFAASPRGAAPVDAVDAGTVDAGVVDAGRAFTVGAGVASAGKARGASFESGKPARVEGSDRFRIVRILPPHAGESGRFLAALELQPSVAHQLDDAALQVLLLALVTGLCVVALAVALTRAWLTRTRLLADLASSRHLAALGEMSAVLAHEIKNPLASLKGHAQLLEEQLDAETRPGQKARLVVGEAQRLEQLVEQLLGFVRSNKIVRADIDGRALAQAIVAEAGGVLEEGAAVSFSGDDALLRQALGNIVRNAVQMTPAGAAPPTVNVASTGSDVVFTVRDHGPGIADEDRARLFEPFFTRRVRGTGLGLATARRIVELHGGTISAANADGGGAVFRVTLPRGAHPGGR